jgi:threonine dehydrogenase-like Zn-dependent dehydrogenase
MKGLTFHGNGDVRVERVDDPAIEQPTDALVRVTLAAICGSDLHVLHAGEAFGFAPGSRLGHEFVGVVEEVGGEVRSLSPGDPVLGSAGISCGACSFCVDGHEFACVQGSMFGWAPRLWRHGGAVQGGQSEYLRVPLADHVLRPTPEALMGTEHAPTLLPLTDVMSTGWHGLASAGFRPGWSAAVIGDGAVGLCAVHGATAMGADQVICLGHHADRLAMAGRLGATALLETRDPEEIRERVRELTRGEGAQVVVDSISSGESMAAAHAAVRAGGTIACLGMDHFMGRTPALDWYDQFVRNISVTGGLIPMGRYIPELLDHVEAGRLDPAPVLSHTLPLEEAAEGYAMMARRDAGVVKVAVSPRS